MNKCVIPDFVDYPTFFDVKEYSKLFNNLYSYIIVPYSLDDGYSLYIGFRNGYVFVRLSDFKSNEYKISDSKYKPILKYVSKLVNLMKTARIVESCYYFSNKSNPVLVDVMISANKFLGPGMIRDIYKKILPTQEIVEIATVSSDNLSKYMGKFIKPSRFKYLIEDKEFRPLYGIVK
jgi:hypothetical protein